MYINIHVLVYSYIQTVHTPKYIYICTYFGTPTHTQAAITYARTHLGPAAGDAHKLSALKKYMAVLAFGKDTQGELPPKSACYLI